MTNANILFSMYIIIKNETLKKLRWLFLLLAAAIPLFFLPGLFADMKLYNLVRKNMIASSVTFTYTVNRQIKCYNDNPDNPESMSYVFLPSYADLTRLGVEAEAERVAFVSDRETITVEGGEYRVCDF